MSPAGEATVSTGAVALSLSSLMGAYLGENLFVTIIPTLIGVALHIDKTKEKSELTLGDMLRAGIVALCVGFWGGPWMAGMAPESELAAPFMCFLCAYFAPDIIRAVHHFMLEKLGGDHDQDK